MKFEHLNMEPPPSVRREWELICYIIGCTMTEDFVIIKLFLLLIANVGAIGLF